MSGYDAGCRQKVKSYSSWSQAERVAQRVRRDRGNNVAPYRCQFCQGVHLGTGLGTNRLDRKIKIEKRRRMEQRWDTTEW